MRVFHGKSGEVSITRFGSRGRKSDSNGATLKRRQQTRRAVWFTWNRMGDRGYREHSAGISCCHDATEKRGARGASEYCCERTAVSTLRTDIKTGCLHSAGAPFWSFDSAPGFYFRTRALRERRETDDEAARPATSRRNFVNRLGNYTSIRQKSTSICIR